VALESRAGRNTKRAEVLAAMHRDLHALCQPLTALQCRLELGRMEGDVDSLREAVEGGLEESQRMFAVVMRMRSCLQAEDAALDEAVNQD
jgi:signal transduction histidine kinase